jgi:hypothetical protein
MIDTEKRKKRIISKIDRLENDFALQQIEKVLNTIFESKEVAGDVIKPVRKQISVEEMIKEQNFIGINRQVFDDLIGKIDIQEPLSELLKSA